jgi:glutathionyl-hydroquinone reductase
VVREMFSIEREEFVDKNFTFNSEEKLYEIYDKLKEVKDLEYERLKRQEERYVKELEKIKDLSPISLFFAEKIQEVEDNNSNEINEILNQMWNNLTKRERMTYEARFRSIKRGIEMQR